MTKPTLSMDDDIIALEQEALDRWCKGDPSGFLDISADDVVYFDPFLDRRIDGLPALTDYYESLRGKIRAVRHEIVDPAVNRIGDAAVLTFHFVSLGEAGDEYRWNCTEVYRRSEGIWRIVQTHWSLTNAGR